MRILVTGSAGHLGEALMRTLQKSGHEPTGLDIKSSPFTHRVGKRRVPCYEAEYQRRGWRMLPTIDRVYVNEQARTRLGWQPRFDFKSIIQRMIAAEDFRSPLAIAVGSKGYHAQRFAEGPYPTSP
ncbi:MAG: NAD-dependent epimerase/dehydratase family protein [Steroidobacteraceae bacterium]